MLSSTLRLNKPQFCLSALMMFLSLSSIAQLFQDDFGTAFSSISTVNWPLSCRGGTVSSFNTSLGPCSNTSDRGYLLSGFGNYISTSAIAVPTTGYELTFEYSYSYAISFPTIEIRTGGTCGTSLLGTTTLTNTAGVCSPETINLDAYSGQTIYIRFLSNTSSASFYFDDPTVDLGAGGAPTCLLSDDFGTAFGSLSTSNWPSSCRGGTVSSFNTSLGPCASTSDRGYFLSGFGSYITTSAIAVPTTGYELTFDYSFSNAFSFPTIEIRTGGTCGTSLLGTTTLTNTAGVCSPETINLDAYSGQTIYIRFLSNTSSANFYFDEVNVCTSATPIDLKWADNFNDNDTNLDYPGIDGNEACTSCGTWTLAGGATLELVPSSGWNGNTNETEAFVANMSNVYYTRLDRNESIESPTLDLSGQESLKISFYAKSSSPATGGGDNWSFSDQLRLQIWNGSSWITVGDLKDELAAGVGNDRISSALPFNYYCFTAYKSNSSPGNFYYNSAPNVNAAYFHSDFKFRVVFEGGFSGSPFAWVDDFTFRADADGYSTMIPCGLSYWNEPAANSYGQDGGVSGNNNAEKGVELELSGSISVPPMWASQADDGDQVSQVFGVGESERVVFCVLSEQEINFAFPKAHFFAPSIGWLSTVMSIDNNYTGPGWRYYAIEYISCSLASGTIAEPTDDYRYYFSFEYGNEFIPAFYHLNTSGIEVGGGATSTSEVFNAPDVLSSNNCDAVLPIELLEFNVTAQSRAALINWSTASEVNNEYFELESSINGTDFETFAKVNGAGNSSVQIDYSYLDHSPVQGVSYYRLKQVDFDGQYSYSEIAVLYFSYTQDAAVLLYPNPASDMLTIEGNTSELVELKVYNLLGVDVSSSLNFTMESDSRVLVNLSNLSPGIYTFKTRTAAYNFFKQ